MRLWLDCSDTYREDIHTGIQRVVRNLVQHAQRLAPARGLDCAAVYHQEGAFWRVERPLTARSRSRRATALREALVRAYWQARQAVATVLPFVAVRRFLFAPSQEFGLSALLKAGLRGPRRLARSLRPGRARSAQPLRTPVPFTPGDVLALLEPVHAPRYWEAVRAAQAQGVRLVTVVYDLIPLSHPHLVQAVDARRFAAWVEQALRLSDAVLAISQATQDAVAEHLAQHADWRARPLPLAHFRLGADLDGQASGAVHPRVAGLLAAPPGVATYLCVGTVEQRKNVGLVLDACERLWQRGLAVRLIVIGRRGWDGDALLARIRRHPQRGRDLLLLHALNDAELALAYAQAQGLVFASQAEGFGLPLVEALHRGLPVFASDLPVLREVAGPHAQYFPLGDAAALADLLAAHIAAGAPRSSVTVAWPDWEQSTGEFLERVGEVMQQGQQGRATAPAAW